MNIKLAGMINNSSPVKQENQPDINTSNNDSTALHTSKTEAVFYSQDQVNVEVEKTSPVKQRYWHEHLKSFNEIFRIKRELSNSWLNVIWKHRALTDQLIHYDKINKASSLDQIRVQYDQTNAFKA